MKQAINCARLKRYLDPPVEDQMLPTDDNAEDGRDYGINDTCHSASNSVGQENIDEAKDDSEHLNKDNEEQEKESMTSINLRHSEIIKINWIALCLSNSCIPHTFGGQVHVH